jgi:hypothetical protein
MNALKPTHGAALWGLVVFASFALICAVRVANAILAGAVIVVYSLLVLYMQFAPLPPQDGEIQSKLIETPSTAVDPETAQPARKQRLYFLDNVKTILTAIVVMHHVACAFCGNGWIYNIGHYRHSFQIFASTFLTLNQSYFMALFFFISGFFVPTSFDRKGPRAYLRDKCRRLGFPFFMYLYILGPLLDFVIHDCFTGDHSKSYTYTVDPGPPWFVIWLLMFSSVYMTFAEPASGWGWALPSRGALIGAALVLGLVQIAMLFPQIGNFVMMPFVHGSLPFDICFFACGIMAKRCNWLDSPLPHEWFFSSISGAIAVLWLVAMVLLYTLGGGLFMVNKYGGDGLIPADVADVSICTDPTKLDAAASYFDFASNQTLPCAVGNSICTANGTKWQAVCGSRSETTNFFVYATHCCSGPGYQPSYTMVLYLAFGAAMGLFAVCFSITILQFSRKHLNFTNKFTSFLSSSAYTVYLIHPWIITPLTYLWVLILRAQGTRVEFPMDSSTSPSHLDSDSQIWFGFVAVGLVSLLLCWPIAHALRSLPGLKQIL